MKLHCDHCGKTFTAPDSWQNTKVRCPACNQIIDTRPREAKAPPKPTGKPTAGSPGSPTAKASAKPASPSTPDSTPRKPGSAATPPPKSPAAAQVSSEDDDDFSLHPEEHRPAPEVFLESTPNVPPSKSPNRPAPRARGTSAQTPAKRAAGSGTPSSPSATKAAAVSPTRRNPVADDPDELEEAKRRREERARKKACPNCRAAMPSGATVCGACGFHLVLKRVISLDVNEDTLHETQGIDRWLRSMMEEGESLDSVFMLFHALLAFVGILLAVVYHPFGWLVFGVAAIIYLAILYFGKTTGSYHRWSLWGWEKLLYIYRRIGWRTLLPPFSRRATLVRHDMDFGDDELEEMENIFDFEVLDFEGSSITDRSLLHLAGCERLQFVVLKRTRVTRKGILRLQSMLPQVLIWS